MRAEAPVPMELCTDTQAQGIHVMISIIVPTYNESGNISDLVGRIHTALTARNIPYEIIFIDDHSTDATVSEIRSAIRSYPVRYYPKKGKKGKAWSLLEGFAKASYDTIAMIDADLQYPPEAIPPMMEQLSTYDIMVANRTSRHTSIMRTLASRTFANFFGSILHGLSCDVQSGLKIMKKSVTDTIHVRKPTAWTFDLEFLVKARHANFRIGNYDINFAQRLNGKSKVKLLQSSWEIGWRALQIKLRRFDVPIRSYKKRQIGFFHNGSKFITYTEMNLDNSAFIRLSTIQLVWLSTATAAVIAMFFFRTQASLIAVTAMLTLLYFVDTLFNLFLVVRGVNDTHLITVPKHELRGNRSRQWPVYTILCPLYREWKVVPQFIRGIAALDYPRNKLQVIILLEQNDTKTIEKIQAMKLPSYVTVSVVPHSLPKTKPKACNFGLQSAAGKYAVIYDAEDIPDPKQLKKVVLSFERADSDIECIQAKLNFYNPHQNILTKLFTIEYSLWFDLVLSGLQSVNAPMPLGGTSNHFRTETLHALGGWDPFNVTEDCDMGMRLAKRGYRTAMIESTTREEANSDFINWLWQRTRWIKGYIQTYLVHTRDMGNVHDKLSVRQRLMFHLVVGGKILSLFVNPMLWTMTILYFAFRPTIGTYIESIYPAPVLYIGTVALVLGNFMYLYCYIIGSIKRGHPELAKYGFLVPFYWLMMSIAAWGALWMLITRPHHWAKTKHGLHLTKTQLRPSYAPVWTK